MSLEFTLTRLVQYVAPKIKKERRLRFLHALSKRYNIDSGLANKTLSYCIHHYPDVIHDIQRKYNVRLLVVKRQQHVTNPRVQLLYDGRHAIVSEDTPLHCFVLTKNNRCKLHTQDLNQMPKLDCRWLRNKRNASVQPLINLLNVDKTVCPPIDLPNDPQSKNDLENFLSCYASPTTKVSIQYGFSSRVKGYNLWYETTPPPPPPTSNAITYLTLYAFTNPEYNVVYAQASEPIATSKQDVAKEYEHYQEMCNKVLEQEKHMGDPFQDNRATSINLSRDGLNLAYDLGLLQTIQELHDLSSKLAHTHSSLYVFLDDHLHLRSITYSDTDTSITVQVPCCQHDCVDFDETLEPWLQKEENIRRYKASSNMLSFWRQVWERRTRWVDQRREIMSPLLHKLEHLVNAAKPAMLTSPYSRCLANIKKMIQHQRIYMYSGHDSHMHSIKFYLSDFAYATLKKCRGVSVKASSDSTLTSLSIPGLTIINLHQYLDCTEDQDFFYPTSSNNNEVNTLEPQPGSIFILHSQKDLRYHHCEFATNKQGKLKTLHMYCKQKGKEWSMYILHYWIQFGLHLLTMFGHDIHGQSSPPSASYLGFQCVMTAYTQASGPMCHALEKTKQYYEHLIRSVSKGGFMFSVEGALNQHDSFTENDPTCRAQSITEMDLVSAYGYSASKTYIPTGFATGFKHFTTLGTQDHLLERLDLKARHHSFEFRAVYKTIHDVMKSPGITIRTVYSNFSPLGLFCIGPYPIDLAIITTTGQVLLYQFDGMWCHGCEECPPLGRYVNGQTLQQVRETTERRNTRTRDWMNRINTAAAASQQAWPCLPLITYNIIQDCCTPGYNTNELTAAFATHPMLAKLVKGYKITDSLGKSPNLSSLKKAIKTTQDLSYTFIAYAKIAIYTAADQHKQPPLVTYEERQNKYTKQQLAFQGQVVLTRNYYQWLKETFNGNCQIHNIDWIIFYATDSIWNTIYDKLTYIRSKSTDKVQVSFIKRMVNLSCGYFGARSSSLDKCQYRLVNSVPSNYSFFLHFPDMNYTMDVGDNSYFLLETKPHPKLRTIRKPSNSALPMFLSIIEYGKLRLVQILHFINHHVHPNHFKLLYSNVDNLVFALANADTLEEAVRPECLASFNQNKHLYFSSTHKAPGLAELKWIRNGTSEWKFITLRTQHYCIVVSEQENTANLHKTAGWSGLSSWEAYTSSKRILEGESLSISQTRRTNKIANMETRQIQLKY